MDFTALFAQGGPYAVIAVLAGVVGKLWTDLREESKGRLEDTKSANATVYTALKTVDTVIATLNGGGK